ncbi:histidine kinase [Maribellus sp. CM-23]|uniref:sensor histidine kinase n=1 Tax=Maribellus sp. CM-23 TaxID=2781026 RepID=UPI001F4727BB|nr:histidine kinase [Maribellus sp. CM-23]MCE4563255.1 histidine kinase [Maribellus sp. CM-23]
MDIRHPFISNPKLTIAYGLFWILVSTVLVLIATLVNGVPLGNSVVETFTFLILYALIGAAIWYVIKFSTLEDNSILRVILAHLIAATIIVFIWMYIGVVVVKAFHPNARQWLDHTVLGRTVAGYIMYVGFVVFFYAVNYYYAFKEKSKNETHLKALVKEAELHALKSQINPHFLFNSLNSISSLTMTDPARAQEMVINLSQLMRYSLKHDQDEKVTFMRELENNKLYLSIEKVRFGKKLNPVFAIEEDCMKAEIPNMILQPLYENAIKYGVYEATETIDVITHCRLNGNMLEIVISNTYDKNVLSKKGEGIGLRNIRDRLQVIYGNPHLLRIEDNNNEFTVTLNIPQKQK